jgi:hypothetical protein
MKKVVAGFILGLVCLFLFSVTWGNKVLSQWHPQSTSAERLDEKYSPDQGSLTMKESWGKRLRLSMNPFDLANGLTFQELDDIRHDPHHRLYAFVYLLGALWLARGLRWSRRHS